MLKDMRRKYHVPSRARFTLDAGTTFVACRLRDAMIARGVFAHGVSQEACLSPDSVRNILNGKSVNPHKTTLSAIAEVLDVPLAFFIDRGMSDEVPASAGVVTSRSTAQPPQKTSPIAQMLMQVRGLDGVTLARDGVAVHRDAYAFPEIMLANLSPSVGRPALTRAPSDCLPHVREGDLILVDLMGEPEGDDLVVHAMQGTHGLRWRISPFRDVTVPETGERSMLCFLGGFSSGLLK